MSTVTAAHSEEAPTRGWRRGATVPFVVMLTSVVVAGTLPFLGDRRFYLADDTTAAWLPTSRRIGELLLDGQSHLMDPELWRGGNFIASARYGVWNPLALLLDVTVLQLDDLAVAMLIVSLVYLLILASGCWLLAREYQAAPWPSAIAGLAAATGGWTLWLDATWWTPHLASLAFTPFVWVAARRTVRSAGAPLWFFVAAVAAVTVGNPYTVVIIGVVVVAVMVESDEPMTAPGRVAVLATLVAIGLVTLFVYLPFQQTSSVGFRESGIFNDEQWSPGAGDLLTSSSPTATPFVDHFGRSVFGFPAVYLAWFALPLAPWLRWRSLARRENLGLAIVAATALVLVLGPSNFWFFRWPIRLLPYLYLPVLVALAVVLGAGLASEHRRRRAVLSAAVIVSGAYLTWADVPDDLAWHLIGALVVAGATGAAVFAGLRRPSLLGPVLVVGTLVVLALQLQWRPVNESLSSYRMATTASEYEENFAGRYQGTVMQVASPSAIPGPDRRPDAAYSDLTVGSSYAIAGVEALTAYSAIGFTTHDTALCIRFDGRVCADGFDRLFRVPDPSTAPLADLLGLDTIVVQRALVETAERVPPPGWQVAETTDHVVVWERSTERAAAGRLGGVTGPIEVEVVGDGAPHREEVSFSRIGEGEAQLTFSRLAWPGYEARLDGRVLAVGGDAAGLVTVAVPASADGGEIVLTWTPPYWRPSLAVLALGVVVAIGTEFAWRRSRRSGDRSIVSR